MPTDFYPNDFVITESVLNIQPQEPALTIDPGSLNFYGAPGQESDPQILRIRNSVAGVQVDSIMSPEGFVLPWPIPSQADPAPRCRVPRRPPRCG
jgi:hypothetical protein